MPPTYRGYVRDPDNEPIAGARVAHTCGQGCPVTPPNLADQPKTYTDKDGRYTLDLPGGPNALRPHEIGCTADDYQAVFQTPNVGLQNATLPIELNFVLDSRIRRIVYRGKVTDPQGKGIRGAVVFHSRVYCRLSTGGCGTVSGGTSRTTRPRGTYWLPLYTNRRAPHVIYCKHATKNVVIGSTPKPTAAVDATGDIGVILNFTMQP